MDVQATIWAGSLLGLTGLPLSSASSLWFTRSRPPIRYTAAAIVLFSSAHHASLDKIAASKK
jgi:hypothetical protein